MRTVNQSNAKTELHAVLGEIMEKSPYSKEQTAKLLISNMIGMAKADGMSDKDIAESLMKANIPLTVESTSAPKKKEMVITPQSQYSMVASQKSSEEIKDQIQLMNTFLLCSELLLSNEMQRYSYHILSMLKEKGLYRQELKKYANKLKEVTDGLQARSNLSDKEITYKQCALISHKGIYVKDFYEDGGGLLNRMAMAFHRSFEIKLKRIRLDNKWVADTMGLKHPDLMAEIFTLTALAESDIELYASVQKHIMNMGRGRIVSRCIKSTHSESIRNAARNLSDRFVCRSREIPKEQAELVRAHLKEFHEDLTGQDQFEFFNGQFLALKMDFVEYYLARLRMDMEKGRLGIAQIRDVWFRMGKKHAVKQFFTELKAIRLPKDKDMDAMDYSKKVAVSKGEQKALNSFRRLSTEGQRILPDKEPQDEWECRVLRSVARKFKGELPDDVLGSMVRVHKTKKAILEKLTQAGFELAPTIRRVKKMKMAELKQL